MHTYYDRWGCQVIEKRAIFSEDGGYQIKITLTPKTLWGKLLVKFGFNFFPVVLADIYEDFRETLSISLERKKGRRHEYIGVFAANRGEKTLRISIEPQTLKKWELDVHIERLFS